MSLNAQEPLLKENRRNFTEEWATYFKYALNFCFKNIAAPDLVPEHIVIWVSYLAISLIFFLDVITDPAVSFHLLYIFPLAFIALHCSRTSVVMGAVALSITLQCVSPLLLQRPALGIPASLFLLITCSNIICALVTRYSRAHTLEVRRLSTTDPLTHLPNRRGLDMAMGAEIMRQHRYGGAFSLALIDLDGFKGLNDTRGHKAGDDALIMLSGILRSQIRQTDTIARLGGDEFVALMPNTGAPDCHALCHLLCHTIRTRLTDSFSYPISASIGFVISENWTENSADILSAADKALYRAKELGKDCVVRGYSRREDSEAV